MTYDTHRAGERRGGASDRNNAGLGGNVPGCALPLSPPGRIRIRMDEKERKSERGAAVDKINPKSSAQFRSIQLLFYIPDEPCNSIIKLT